MSAPNRVQAEWDSYLREVIPVDAPAVQISESKRAFFAGAQAILGVVIDIGDDDEDEDGEKGVQILSEVHAELQAFSRDVEAGRA